MKTLHVLGMDPSLSNWGIAGARLDLAPKRLEMIGLELVSPDIPTGKTVRQNSKDLARAAVLSGRIISAASTANTIFVEVPVGSQSSRAMASYGICVGILGVLRSQGLNFIEVTPTEVKLASVGSKRASKLEMIEWAMTTYPALNWPETERMGTQRVILGRAEHLADAVAAIHAGIRTDAFLQMSQALKSLPDVVEPDVPAPVIPS